MLPTSEHMVNNLNTELNFAMFANEISHNNNNIELQKGKRTQPSDDHKEDNEVKKCKIEVGQTLDKLQEKAKECNKPDSMTTALEYAANVHAHQHQSPKKRLELPSQSTAQNSSTLKQKPKEKFIYGNYSKYYGYRNKDFQDIRLNVFETHRSLFEDKLILDIGCNSGLITLELAKRFPIKHITGIDIDRGLVNQASKHVTKCKKAAKQNSISSNFPFNVNFLHANYVLRDDILLEIESEQFDMILCLSVTKWIHLNFGDAGLKQSFRRMFRQLRPGGRLILEPQPYDNYGRRKKMTATIFSNYKAMKFFPKDFTEYLLSDEVGFASVVVMGAPEHCVAGFKRPIQIFNKS